MRDSESIIYHLLQKKYKMTKEYVNIEIINTFFQGKINTIEILKIKKNL